MIWRVRWWRSTGSIRIRARRRSWPSRSRQRRFLMVCQALQALGAAGMSPDDPAWPVLRDRMGLPAPPEPTPEMMGMLGQGRRGRAGLSGTARSDIDAQVDDLGATPPGAGKRGDDEH